MSVIFQLFDANYLKNLADWEFEALISVVSSALTEDPHVLQRPEIERRAFEVFDQLGGILRFPREKPQRDCRQRPSAGWQGILFCIFHDDELERLSRKKLAILEWAIICELTHNRLAVVAVRDQVDKFLQRQDPERELPDPDTNYHNIPRRPEQ